MTSTDNSVSPRARVLAVVLSWNEHDWTERAVRSLVAQDIATDVLVVDNASEEDPTERFEALGERVSVERMPSNLGVAGGRNVGLRRALEGDWGWVLIFDNDAEAAPDMVRRLMEEGDAAERIGMVGPKIYRLDQPDVIWRVGSTSWKWTYLHLGPEVLDRIWRSAGRWPRRFLDTHRGRDQRDVGQFDTPEDVDFQIGCVQLIRTDTLRDVGLLDEDFSPYGSEDIDLCARLRGRGWRIRYAPRANAWHRVLSSFRGSYRRTYFNTRHILLLARKRLPAAYFWGVFVPEWLALGVPLRVIEATLHGDSDRRRAVLDAVKWNVRDAVARGRRAQR